MVDPSASITVRRTHHRSCVQIYGTVQYSAVHVNHIKTAITNNLKHGNARSIVPFPCTAYRITLTLLQAVQSNKVRAMLSGDGWRDEQAQRTESRPETND